MNKNKKVFIIKAAVAAVSLALSLILFLTKAYSDTVFAVFDAGWVAVILCFSVINFKKLSLRELPALLSAALCVGFGFALAFSKNGENNIWFFTAAVIAFCYAATDTLEKYAAEKTELRQKGYISAMLPSVSGAEGKVSAESSLAIKLAATLNKFPSMFILFSFLALAVYGGMNYKYEGANAAAAALAVFSPMFYLPSVILNRYKTELLKNGVYIKSSAALELSAQVNTVVFAGKAEESGISDAKSLSGILDEDKADAIEEMQKDGAFILGIGGAGDAAFLSQCNVSASAEPDAPADAIITDNDFSKAEILTAVSKKAVKALKLAPVFAFLTNLALVGVCLANLLPAAVAAVIGTFVNALTLLPMLKKGNT